MEQLSKNDHDEYIDREPVVATYNIWELKGFEYLKPEAETTGVQEDEHSDVIELPKLEPVEESLEEWTHEVGGTNRTVANLAEIIRFPDKVEKIEKPEAINWATVDVESGWNQAKERLANEASESSRNIMSYWEGKRQEADRARVLGIMDKINQLEKGAIPESDDNHKESLNEPTSAEKDFLSTEMVVDNYTSNEEMMATEAVFMTADQLKEMRSGEGWKEYASDGYKLENLSETGKFLYEINRLEDIRRSYYRSKMRKIPIIGRIHRAYATNMAQQTVDIMNRLEEGALTPLESKEIIGETGPVRKPSKLKSLVKGILGLAKDALTDKPKLLA